MPKNRDEIPVPMPVSHARHLLNPARRLFQNPRKLVSRLHLKPDSTVLELGPGPGYFSVELARAVPRGRLILVDLQTEMLAMARRRLAEAGQENAEARVADAQRLPLPDHACDAAFLASVLGEIPHREASLRELHRVLKPGGLLSVTELKWFDPDYIPARELERSLHSVGFALRRSYDGLWSYTRLFEKR